MSLFKVEKNNKLTQEENNEKDVNKEGFFSKIPNFLKKNEIDSVKDKILRPSTTQARMDKERSLPIKLKKNSSKDQIKINILIESRWEFTNEWEHQRQVLYKMKALRAEYLFYSKVYSIDLTRELFLVRYRIKTLTLVVNNITYVVNHLNLINCDNEINKIKNLFHRIRIATEELEKVYGLDIALEEFSIQNQKKPQCEIDYSEVNEMIEKIDASCLSFSLNQSALNLMRKRAEFREFYLTRR